eukprot:CAMPEP_0118699402 /NCGR_PEP_ID=MMETSP0800-20121206/15875_1 /TAXON_ID=210618 ORGANISM="Striatella unipunctata, Strain CCMP2910" /NCGR_SAMPLE_ID=MMETSP0800 /ASSEMBLY_ACC=CAM_ASM_000638 /LENGTH=97 /DNA_ID=CAMNT_0006599607 /DNA_START=81 /DNA_END=371 /DNA_ORIENTATION=-
MQYHSVRQIARANNQPVAPGSLKKIIKGVLKEHNLDKDDPNFVIPQSTIHSRIQTNNLTKSKKGITSPMEPLEPLITDVFIQKHRMGQPMGTTEGLC